MTALSRRILLLLLLRRRVARRNKYQKRVWVRKLFQERKSKVEFRALVRDLKLYDSGGYFFK